MKALRPLLVCIVCSLFLLHPCAALAQQSPAELVQGVYNHFTGNAMKQASDFELLTPFASQELVRLMEAEAACQATGEICNYDFSVIVDGQEYELTELRVTETYADAARKEVTAGFRNFGKPTKVVYVFARQGSRWLLDDVRSAEQPGWSLQRILRP